MSPRKVYRRNSSAARISIKLFLIAALFTVPATSLFSQDFDSNEVIITKEAGSLVFLILPREGTRSALLTRERGRYKGITLETTHGYVTEEPRLNKDYDDDTRYAVSTLDGYKEGEDELHRDGRLYMRFKLDERELFDQLGGRGGKHRLTVIEYITDGASRGSQYAMDDYTFRSEYENKRYPHRSIEIKFSNAGRYLAGN